MTSPVFVSPDVASVRVGDRIVVTGAEAKHAAVQRVAPGDRVDLVDGRGTRATAEVAAASAERLEVEVLAVARDADAEVVLVQALAKAGRDEFAIEAATELGATRIIPWESARAVVRWRGPKAAKGRASWADAVAAAAKQSRRACIPEVDEVVDTAALAGLVAEAVARGARVILLHEEASRPLASAHVPGEPLPPVWFIVGPEGGVAPEEVDALTAAGAEATRLGPHVLRASTAGPAAIAAYAALRGQWDSTAPSRPGLR